MKRNRFRGEAKGRSGKSAWLGLICLVLGLGLLDRGFVKWRNDPRNFRYANGHYPTAAEIPPEFRSQMSDPKAAKDKMVSGGTFLLFSVVLFGAEPIRRGQEGRDGGSRPHPFG